MIYFDNAASTHPKPQSVIRAMSGWLHKNAANAGRSGHRMSMEAAEMVYNTRVAVGDFFGVKKAEQVVLVPGATYALNTVILGLLNKGDHVITTDLEHNSVLRPLWHLRKKGVDVTVVSVNFEDDEKTVEMIMRNINSRTRAIVCTQASNVCGKILPIKEIAVRKPRNVYLIVDGSQGAGTLPIDIIEDGIDYYCAPSHKGLMGPQGGGILLLNNVPPKPLVLGGTGTEGANPEQPRELPEYLESGTLSTPICVGMKAGIEFIRRLGIERSLNHKRALTDYAYDELRKLDHLELYMCPYKDTCVGVIPFNVRGMDSNKVVEYLDQNNICARGGIHCSPLFHKRFGTIERGMVRISFGCFNNDREVNELVKVLKKIN
ncbi:MAG: aminotransferase class V-fold PLP-dependent enzyme [Clostridia bacterium]|nr:aminotransferase class V-fold PLP-dependent enzyme [Clostridia bacterium]